MVPSSSTSSSKRRWPVAAAICVALCAAVTLACWAGIRAGVDDEVPVLLYVGDTFTGNYRFDPGERLEDITAPPGDWQVHNFAWPGARTLDILLQVQKAETLLGRVDRVVLPLFVNKFIVGEPYIRLDKRGDNLKWLHLDSGALPVAETFDDELQRKLLIHKLGLLVGFYDLLEYLFVQHQQWPGQRQRMRKDPPDRRAKINAKNQRRARIWDERNITPQEVTTSGAARDLNLLVDYLKRRGIPLLILWLPPGNMDVVKENFSPRAQQNIQAARAIAMEWSAAHGVDHVDLFHALPGAYYDDFTHLNDVRGNRIIAEAAAQWVDPQKTVDLAPAYGATYVARP